MSEHVTEWLNALLDSELRGPRVRQVEDHLAGCAACRRELGDLQHLSQMLKEAAPAEGFQPADRFIADLTLMLPGREDNTPSHTGSQNIGWWLTPFGAAAVLAILQSGLAFSGLLSTARTAGMLDGAASWFSSAPPHSAWFSAALGLFGSHLGGNGITFLNLLESLVVLRSDLATELAWQAGFGLLYWTLLGLWWARLGHRVGGPPAWETSQFALKQPGQENPRARIT
jgi:Putative zinc-finger